MHKKHLLLSLSCLLLGVCSFLLLTCSFLPSSNIFAQFEIPGDNTIYNQDPSQALNAEWIDDPLRQGAFKVINAQDNNPENKLWGITSADTEITTHPQSESAVLKIISNIINYALGLVSLVALIYLIYHGILVLTAAWDETQYKRWLKWVKYAAIALAWLWLSRILISFIFYVINGIINWF